MTCFILFYSDCTQYILLMAKYLTCSSTISVLLKLQYVACIVRN